MADNCVVGFWLLTENSSKTYCFHVIPADNLRSCASGYGRLCDSCLQNCDEK